MHFLFLRIKLSSKQHSCRFRRSPCSQMPVGDALGLYSVQRSQEYSSMLLGMADSPNPHLSARKAECDHLSRPLQILNTKWKLGPHIFIFINLCQDLMWISSPLRSTHNFRIHFSITGSHSLGHIYALSFRETT